MDCGRPVRGFQFPWQWVGYVLLAIVAGQGIGPANLRGGEDERPAQKWALLIGIDKYVNYPDLPSCGNDERDLGAQLVKAGYGANRVFVMRDAARKKSLLPTKENIERQLELLLDPTKGLVGAGDLVIVSFSGYGISLRGKSYFCPPEADENDPLGTMIPLDRIYRQIDRSRAAHKLLVVDVCRDDPAHPTIAKTMSHGFFNFLNKVPRGMLLLSSCGEGQKALNDPALGHSLFIHFLLDGLSGKAAHAEGDITLTNLYLYTSTQTRRYAAKKFKSFQLPALEGRTEGRFEVCRLDPDALPARPAPPADQKKPTGTPGEVVMNSIGMKLALVPAGEFLMGSPETEMSMGNEHESIEYQHRVEITRPFYLGIYEVTQAQFQLMMGKNPSRFSGIGPLKDKLKGLNTSLFPVEHVTLDETVEFCRRLSEKEGKTYRLPTEAEWEYACRAGTSTPYSFGEACNGRQANCNGEKPYGTKTKGPYLERTTKVGSYRPNAFGLFDMHGNVWERCSDLYDGKYYEVSPLVDPEGPASGGYNVSRGGSWFTLPVSCRSASRYGNVPSFRADDLGFRVCLNVEDEPETETEPTATAAAPSEKPEPPAAAPPEKPEPAEKPDKPEPPAKEKPTTEKPTTREAPAAPVTAAP